MKQRAIAIRNTIMHPTFDKRGSRPVFGGITWASDAAYKEEFDVINNV